MIGLLFGSFNPIHLGHTALANYLLTHAGLDEVWFVVSPHNPLKKQADLLDDAFRLQLVNFAIADNPSFKACDVEFSMPTPNYTHQTLEKLHALYPNKEFTLLIGADNLAVFHLWKAYEQLLANFAIIVYPRTGFNVALLHEQYPQVKVIEAPLFPISSTEIRELIAQKKDASTWLHPFVYKALLKQL